MIWSYKTSYCRRFYLAAFANRKQQSSLWCCSTIPPKELTDASLCYTSAATADDTNASAVMLHDYNCCCTSTCLKDIERSYTAIGFQQHKSYCAATSTRTVAAQNLSNAIVIKKVVTVGISSSQYPVVLACYHAHSGCCSRNYINYASTRQISGCNRCAKLEELTTKLYMAIEFHGTVTPAIFILGNGESYLAGFVSDAKEAQWSDAL
ncbi:PREDICTED: uncharacterized protein LOC109233904 [Nicotiana attenuata]|uniref:Uncharacterized protein n=1 Tax=Nicotiana attenuata TaxID=49451 RepID=A0A1J6IS40_NICAT|nr:PREDICTED: uncharacterized protein LOC109233904 [Nicotiana attenuata]OIS97960.1 hypothetical protein A4A49_18562 [Nicotiana attenuata]